MPCPERQPFGQVSSPADDRGVRGARPQGVPNVNRSGKYHHTPRDVAFLRSLAVPNVNRSGKYHHTLTATSMAVCAESRTSTVRASIITERSRAPVGLDPLSRTSTVRASIIPTLDIADSSLPHFVPHVNRSGKYHHAVHRQGARADRVVPNVNRSGKYHHECCAN